jgi:DNA-binding beta-propeller fold protein YncE
VISVLRRYMFIYCLCILLFCLLSCFARSAYADGGAPQLAYVAGSAQGISVIDIAQRRVVRTIPLAGNPSTVLLSPDGQMLYVAQPGLGRVAAINAKTGEIACTAGLAGQPSLLALSLDATVLYAAGQGGTRVSALNPTTCAIQRTFETHEPVYGLAVAASTAVNATPSTPNQIWATGSMQITVFDATGQLLGTVSVVGGPQNISIPGGFTAYVTTRQHTVLAVDLETRKVIRTLLSGGQFGRMDFDETTGEVYVPDEQRNRLDVLTPVTIHTTVMPREPARILPVSGSPQSVAITNDGQLGFVALSNGQVVMLDIPGRTGITTLAVGGMPHFIITGLYPPTTIAPVRPRPPVPSSSPRSIFPIVISVLAGGLLLVTLWLLRQFYHRRAVEQFSKRKRL